MPNTYGWQNKEVDDDDELIIFERELDDEMRRDKTLINNWIIEFSLEDLGFYLLLKNTWIKILLWIKTL